MASMTDGGKEWLGKLPSDWNSMKIKFCCDSIYAGGTPDTTVSEYWDGDIPWLPSGVCHDCVVSDIPRYITKLGLLGSSTKMIPAGSTLVAMTGATCGGTAFLPFDACANQSVIAYIENKEKAIGKFLFYAMQAAKQHLLTFQSGGAQAGVNSQDCKNVIIPFPDKVVQEKIVRFLDDKCSDIDALSLDIQGQIDTLEKYKRSVVFETVCKGIKKNRKMKKTDSDVWSEIPSDWELKDIKYLFEIVKRIAGKEGYDVLSVTQKGLKIKDIKSGDGQLADSYAGYQFVYPTDYVMNHMDLLTGWVDLSKLFGVTSPDYRVFRLRDKKKNNLDYYKYVMQCCYMNKIFYSLGQGVSNLGRWRLQTSSFNNFLVPVPTTDEQEEIAKYLNYVIDETNEIIDTKREQINILSELKKSFIYEYVTGKKEVPAV